MLCLPKTNSIKIIAVAVAVLYQQQQSKDTSHLVSQSSSSSRSLKHKVNEFYPLFVVRHYSKLKNNV